MRRLLDEPAVWSRGDDGCCRRGAHHAAGARCVPRQRSGLAADSGRGCAGAVAEAVAAQAVLAAVSHSSSFNPASVSGNSLDPFFLVFFFVLRVLLGRGAVSMPPIRSGSGSSSFLSRGQSFCCGRVGRCRSCVGISIRDHGRARHEPGRRPCAHDVVWTHLGDDTKRGYRDRHRTVHRVPPAGHERDRPSLPDLRAATNSNGREQSRRPSRRSANQLTRGSKCALGIRTPRAPPPSVRHLHGRGRWQRAPAGSSR